jgi:hypothetical protein
VSANPKFYDGGLLKINPTDIVLGIDQSYSGFGLTALSAQGSLSYAAWVYKAQHTGISRLVDIWDYLAYKFYELENTYDHTIVDVAMEGYAYSSQMAHLAGELGGVVKFALHSHLTGNGQLPLIVPPTTLKKYVAGKGTGVSKSQMLLNVYKKWGVEFDDDNAADSFSLAMIVSGRSTTAYEKEVLDKLQKSSTSRDSNPVIG